MSKCIVGGMSATLSIYHLYYVRGVKPSAFSKATKKVFHWAAVVYFVGFNVDPRLPRPDLLLSALAQYF